MPAIELVSSRSPSSELAVLLEKMLLSREDLELLKRLQATDRAPTISEGRLRGRSRGS